MKFFLMLLAHAIQRAALAILQKLPAEYRYMGSYEATWQPTPFHQCVQCHAQLHFDGQYWVCPGCNAQYWFVPIQQIQRHTEPMKIGDLTRAHHASMVKREHFRDGEQTQHLPSLLPPAREVR